VIDSPSWPEKSLRLQPAIEKLTSLTPYIECLISVANSPRLRLVLESNLSIETVVGQSCIVRLPQSKAEWQRILNVAATGEQDLKEDHAGKLAKYFERNIRECPSPCESTLAQTSQ